ncbi:ABC transporter G family member 24 [Tanacetum coccineum]
MKLNGVVAVVIVIVVVAQVVVVQCQVVGDEFEDQINDTAFLPFVTHRLYASLSNVTTTILESDVGTRSSFCVKDRQVEWDRAFNFSSNLDFLSNCLLKTNGDVPQRLCNSAELKFYFGGWACATKSTENPDMRDQNIPARTRDCQPCCEGFFCPSGLTCMIPCPLGSHCPTATLDRDTGMCKPYTYQLPPAMPNHTCGGANIWADIKTSGELFCSKGSYCPTSTQELNCSKGHYCQTGSISEKACFKLTSCGSNSSSQNIHAYGAMLIAAIFTILLIIYNCSDQIITTRERRHAKSREAAARHAKEKIKAHERWKMAREAAKKHAAQISRTFSRKKASPQTEELSMLPENRYDIDDDQITPVTSHSSSGENRLELRSQAFNAKGKDEDLYSQDHSAQIKDTHGKKKMPKEKHVQTHSQIFNYAYGQIEKEKAMQENHNLTFSGVISMAVNTEIRKRPKIEISFRDLTLTLKGKGQHLLRAVTGKIMPGRITAVMGPSGAGKTTFLSALAGKAHGCKITGSILINGKPDSIHAYKKIIGFVPQDDIVHGNLTVEENLWFSAKCRNELNEMKNMMKALVPTPVPIKAVEERNELQQGLTNRSGVVLTGPLPPMPSSIFVQFRTNEVCKETEVTKDQVQLIVSQVPQESRPPVVSN